MSIYRGIALTVAGSDSGGGAGIQADLKTFAALKVFGTSAITAITAQNSLGVHGIHNVPSEIVTAQLDAVLSDFSVDAIKTGMLSRSDTITALCASIKKYNVEKVVVDPVMIAQSGDSLISDDAADFISKKLFPLAMLVTPNIPEAEKLSNTRISNVTDMEFAAVEIAKTGASAVLVKGGHMTGDTLTDVLYYNNEFTRFTTTRILTEDTHGTGCTLSSAIAAELAAGADLKEAVIKGREYLLLALKNSFKPGHGYGPLGHAVEAEWI